MAVTICVVDTSAHATKHQGGLDVAVGTRRGPGGAKSSARSANACLSVYESVHRYMPRVGARLYLQIIGGSIMLYFSPAAASLSDASRMDGINRDVVNACVLRREDRATRCP